MKRDRSGRPREGATLGDALSPLEKDRLHRLRDTLAEQAREAVASQLTETRPPWQRKPPKPQTLRNVPGPPAVKVHQQPKQRKTTLRAEPKTQRMPASTRKPQTSAFEYWDFPGEAAVREPPPASISATDRRHFEELLQAGAESPTAGGEDLFIILGLDFGTSSTKMIVRLPYEAGEPTIAIPSPASCRSGDNPYLWRTVLWVREDGAFRPWPEKGATVLHSLKQGLIAGRSETTISGCGATVTVSRAHAGVAYLAFAVRYVRGWLLRNRPYLFQRRRPVWFLNLGMPAASHDDPKLAESYRRIGAAALQFTRIGSPVTVESVRLFFNDPDVAKAGASEEAAEGLRVAVFPETAAEMTGFAKSTRGSPGIYLLVDVGAMTLDACMFRLDRHASTGDLYAFMAAQIRPLGVESFHWFLTEGKTEKEFFEQCSHTLRAVVWKTKKHRDPMAASWKSGNDIPVFLAGGGAANPLHRKVVESLGPWLQQHAGNDGIRLLELPMPDTIELPEPLQGFGRMAVAWGLSYTPTEIGQTQTVRDIEDIPPPVVADRSARLITKDDV